MNTWNEQLGDVSRTDWNHFFENHTVLVPYLDMCVFAAKHLSRMQRPDALVYEFGCGVGNNILFLRSIFPKIRLLGSDISQVAIDKLVAKGLENSDFWVSNSDLMLGGRGPVDLVIERGAMQHVPKDLAKQYVRQIHDALKTGGSAYFEIASTAHDKFEVLGGSGLDKGFGYRTFYTIEEIKELFRDFSITRIYHLQRELCYDPASDAMQVQGSFQVEVSKA